MHNYTVGLLSYFVIFDGNLNTETWLVDIMFLNSITVSRSLDVHDRSFSKHNYHDSFEWAYSLISFLSHSFVCHTWPHDSHSKVLQLSQVTSDCALVPPAVVEMGPGASQVEGLVVAWLESAG